MNGLGNVRIKGISGKMYTFRAYPLDTKFQNFGAVYFITGRNRFPDGRIAHRRISCGRTNDLSDITQHTSSFKVNGANCICILPQEDKDSRIEIENDIRQNYTLLCNT